MRLAALHHQPVDGAVPDRAGRDALQLEQLQCREREPPVAQQRVADLAGGYRWTVTGPAESASSAEITDFLAKRARFDEDFWAVELDIADPERFIAETTASG